MTDPYYTSRYTFDKRRTIVWKEIVRFLRPFLCDKKVVVDLGAGYCDFINNTSAEEKYAVDISTEIDKFAGEDVKKIKFPAWNLSLIKSRSTDVVFASNLLEHFTDEEIQKTTTEIMRVLKPRGILILMQPNYRLSAKKYFDDPTHKKIWSDASLKSFLISNSFDILLAMPRFLPFSMRSNSPLIPDFLLPFIVRAYIHSPLKPFAGQMLFVAQK